ncbi:hypothetical protein BJY52DRAFT_1420965 [Lactarius psammicola]|nr:hypothetical protein BJY52DRAFT_1420965 [Lactarius psammicola]
MYHNLSGCQRQSSSKSYSAKPTFLDGLEWQPGSGGHVLAHEDTRVHALRSLVGRVLEYRFACGPSGNYRNTNYGSLATAKYQSFLGKPVQTLFADDFNKVIGNLEIAQDRPRPPWSWTTLGGDLSEHGISAWKSASPLTDVSPVEKFAKLVQGNKQYCESDEAGQVREKFAIGSS